MALLPPSEYSTVTITCRGGEVVVSSFARLAGQAEPLNQVDDAVDGPGNEAPVGRAQALALLAACVDRVAAAKGVA